MEESNTVRNNIVETSRHVFFPPSEYYPVPKENQLATLRDTGKRSQKQEEGKVMYLLKMMIKAGHIFFPSPN